MKTDLLSRGSMEKVSFGQKTKVLVVGAGPIGLAAALEFANFEIETLVVDELSEINRASKAICWSQRSLEILNRVGLAAVSYTHLTLPTTPYV